MERIRLLLRMAFWGPLLDYHLKKKDTIDPEYITVHRYHYEMSKHYYKKIYGNKR